MAAYVPILEKLREDLHAGAFQSVPVEWLEANTGNEAALVEGGVRLSAT